MAEAARGRRRPGAAGRTLLATAGCLAAALRAGAIEPAASGLEGPFAVRDENPLLRPFYLPVPRLAPDEGIGYALLLAWSNTTNLPHSATEQLYVDAETADLGLRATYRRGAWLAAAELPVVWRGGGILDGVIDDWHGLLGVNRGYRPYVQSNSYRITYEANGAAPVSVAKGPALADIPLEVGRLLYVAPGTELAAWAGVKVPTGSRNHATGSGAVDASAWLSGGQSLGSRWDAYAQVGAMRAGGSGEFVRVRRYTEFGSIGLAWRATASVSALAQVDAHSALAPSSLTFLQPAVTGTVGARVALNSGLALDIGIQEDLATNHSPDVTLCLSVHTAPRRRAIGTADRRDSD